MAAEWAASPAQVAALLPDRVRVSAGAFDDTTDPTLHQVQAILDLVEPRVLTDTWALDATIPEALHPLATLAHAYLAASHVENNYGEQVEQTARAEFLNRRALEHIDLLRRNVVTDQRDQPADA